MGHLKKFCRGTCNAERGHGRGERAFGRGKPNSGQGAPSSRHGGQHACIHCVGQSDNVCNDSLYVNNNLSDEIQSENEHVCDSELSDKNQEYVFNVNEPEVERRIQPPRFKVGLEGVFINMTADTAPTCNIIDEASYKR